MNHPIGAQLAADITTVDATISEEDGLERAILWVCAYHDRPTTSIALWAGLPRARKMSPSLALRALAAHGMSAGLVRRNPQTLFEYLMPVVLLLKDGGACILLKRLPPGVGGAGLRYEVILPEAGDARIELTEEQLAERFSGHCLLIKPEPKVDLRGGDPVPVAPSHWLWSTLWRYKRYYASTMIAALMINVLTVATSFFTMNVYDRVVPTQAYTTLWSLAIGVVIAMIFEFLSRHIRGYVLDIAGKKADLVMGSLLFRQALSVRLETRPANAGSFAHQLREYESVRDFVTSATMTTLTDLPFVALFVIATYMIAGPLAWVIFLALPIVIGASMAIQWPLSRVIRENLRESSHKHGVVVEAVEGIDALKASGAEGFMQQKYESYSAATAGTAMKSRLLSSLASNFVTLVTQLCTVALVVWGVYLIHAGQLTMGGLIGAMILSGRALAPLAMVAGLAARYQQAKSALETLNRLMAQPTERDPTRTYLSCPPIDQRLELSDLSFAYPGPKGVPPRPVLKHISVKIEAGERVAILGRIGSGKSTLLHLMAGMYRPTEGQVLVDGLDVRQVDPGEWRRAVGFVSQEPRLFFGTLRENILMARPQASAEAFLKVSRLTGLDRLAASHPLGYDMPIGEMGRGLSGGQQQLVALARCLLSEPRALLMDEPTSAMDMQTESHFMQHLMSAIAGRTFVLVTHRPSLLALIDRIIVIDDGQIVADGPKDQVLAALTSNTQEKA
jgi:ATP-binding cassette subfamily C protein LapB